MTVQHNISLKPFNTFGIDVRAKQFAIAKSVDDIKELLDSKLVDKHGMMILGGGSNVLFTRDVNGTVLKNEISGIELIHEDEEYIHVKAGAGVNWHSFVLYCLQENYAGVENLSLIPGNVGASPMQNIGAYGVELKDVFHALTAINIQDKQEVSFDKETCKFGYRDSVFKGEYKNQFIITSVTFALSKKPVFHTSYGTLQQEIENSGEEISIRSISDAVIRIRQSKLPDPKIIGNAGSFFKNPNVSETQFQQLKESFPEMAGYKSDKGFKLAAAWLIEQCGWKGYRNGDAGCHVKQPLVLVNYSNARGEEILELSNKIIDSVEKKFNIKLEREVNIF